MEVDKSNGDVAVSQNSTLKSPELSANAQNGINDPNPETEIILDKCETVKNGIVDHRKNSEIMKNLESGEVGAVNSLSQKRPLEREDALVENGEIPVDVPSKMAKTDSDCDLVEEGNLAKNKEIKTVENGITNDNLENSDSGICLSEEMHDKTVNGDNSSETVRSNAQKSDNIFEKLNQNLSKDDALSLNNKCLSSNNINNFDTVKNSLSLNIKLKESFKGLIKAAASKVGNSSPSNCSTSDASEHDSTENLAEQCKDITSTSKMDMMLTKPPTTDISDKGNLFENFAKVDSMKLLPENELTDKSSVKQIDDDIIDGDKILLEDGNDLVTRDLNDIDESILDKSDEDSANAEVISKISEKVESSQGNKLDIKEKEVGKEVSPKDGDPMKMASEKAEMCSEKGGECDELKDSSVSLQISLESKQTVTEDSEDGDKSATDPDLSQNEKDQKQMEVQEKQVDSESKPEKTSLIKVKDSEQTDKTKISNEENKENLCESNSNTKLTTVDTENDSKTVLKGELKLNSTVSAAEGIQSNKDEKLNSLACDVKAIVEDKDSNILKKEIKTDLDNKKIDLAEKVELKDVKMIEKIEDNSSVKGECSENLTLSDAKLSDMKLSKINNKLLLSEEMKIEPEVDIKVDDTIDIIDSSDDKESVHTSDLASCKDTSEDLMGDENEKKEKNMGENNSHPETSSNEQKEEVKLKAKTIDSQIDSNVVNTVSAQADQVSETINTSGDKTESTSDKNVTKPDAMETDNESVISISDDAGKKDSLNKPASDLDITLSDTNKTETKPESSADLITNGDSRKRCAGSPPVEDASTKKSRLESMVGGLASRLGKQINELDLKEDNDSKDTTEVESSSSSSESESDQNRVYITQKEINVIVKKRIEVYIKAHHRTVIADMQNRIDKLHEETEIWKKTAKELSKKVIEITDMPRPERRRLSNRVPSRNMSIQVDEMKIQAAARGLTSPLKPPNGFTGQTLLLQGNKLVNATGVIGTPNTSPAHFNSTAATIHPDNILALKKHQTVREMLDEQRGVQLPKPALAGATTTILTSPKASGSMVVDLTEDDDPNSPPKAGSVNKPVLIQQQGQPMVRAPLVPGGGLPPGIKPGTYLLQSGLRGGAVLQQLVSTQAGNVRPQLTSPTISNATVVLGTQGGPAVLNLQNPPIQAGQAVRQPGNMMLPQLSSGAQVLVRGQGPPMGVRPPPPLQSAPNVNINKTNPPSKTVAKKRTSPLNRKSNNKSPDIMITTITKPLPARTHPAPLPPQPTSQATGLGKKVLPPKPTLKISRVAQGIVLSWNMTLSDNTEEVTNYQLFAYQEGAAAPTSLLWKKVGDVKALPLPMACTLTQFQEGNKYHFAVRAMDKHQRVGPFSEPSSIHLTAKS